MAEFVDRAVTIAKQVKDSSGRLLKDFNAALNSSPPPELATLKHDVE